MSSCCARSLSVPCRSCDGAQRHSRPLITTQTTEPDWRPVSVTDVSVPRTTPGPYHCPRCIPGFCAVLLFSIPCLHAKTVSPGENIADFLCCAAWARANLDLRSSFSAMPRARHCKSSFWAYPSVVSRARFTRVSSFSSCNSPAQVGFLPNAHCVGE